MVPLVAVCASTVGLVGASAIPIAQVAPTDLAADFQRGSRVDITQLKLSWQLAIVGPGQSGRGPNPNPFAVEAFSKQIL